MLDLPSHPTKPVQPVSLPPALLYCDIVHPRSAESAFPQACTDFYRRSLFLFVDLSHTPVPFSYKGPGGLRFGRSFNFFCLFWDSPYVVLSSMCSFFSLSSGFGMICDTNCLVPSQDSNCAYPWHSWKCLARYLAGR